MSSEEKAILNTKDKMPEFTETPPAMQKPKSSPQALKERLEWGEPGFTILDVRDRDSFNKCRIMGAMPSPLNDPDVAERTRASLQKNREIYVYGNTDEESAEAASQLHADGFNEVAAIEGGLAAWKAVGAPTEGTQEQGEKVAGKGAYTLGERLEENQDVQEKF